MENQQHQLYLLIMLKKMGVEFNYEHGIVNIPIIIMGKMEPIDYSEGNIYIKTWRYENE